MGAAVALFHDVLVTVGALSIQSSRQGAFAKEAIAIFQTMANQLAHSIENAYLFEETQRAMEELKAIREMTFRANGVLLPFFAEREILLADFKLAVAEAGLADRRYAFGGTPPVAEVAREVGLFEAVFAWGRGRGRDSVLGPRGLTGSDEHDRSLAGQTRAGASPSRRDLRPRGKL